MKARKQLVACVLSFALLFGMIPTEKVSAAKKTSLSTKKLTVTKGKSKTLTVKNTKKKVEWKILSGKKCITLKEKSKVAATIKGRKEGTAKVQAKTGKKKLTCNVIVKNGKKTNVPTASTKPAVTTPPSGSGTINEPAGSHEQDVAALKALIKEQRGRGATVSEDIHSKEYVWKNDRLTEIHWNYTYDEDNGYGEKNLKGDISFSPFTELEVLECGSAGGSDDRGELTSFDITKNVKLIKLNCRAKSLKSLDVSNNVNLEELDCSGNELTSLDVTKNVKLERLETYRNWELNSLDVSKNVNLKYLSCLSNPLSSLDITKNVQLVELDVRDGNLSSLDVSKNVNLEKLYCNVNKISSLDLTNNVNLKVLWCDSNQITSLNLINNTKITDLSCDDDVTVIGYTQKG